MSDYKILIFDFDGVILNSHKVKTKTFFKIFSKYGLNVGHKARKLHLKYMGMPRKKKINLINNFYLNNSLTKDELKKINDKFKIIVQNEILRMNFNKNLINFLKKKKIKFYISTGTDQSEIIKLCKLKKISNFFIKIYGSPKTKIQHISDIIKKNNVSKKKILFIGDSITDYKAAKMKKIDFLCKSNSENKDIFRNINVKRIYKFQQLSSL